VGRRESTIKGVGKGGGRGGRTETGVKGGRVEGEWGWREGGGGERRDGG